ncbi:MAG TPA: Fe-S cluster assembly protein SufD [Burkholderiales bacterium]|nr:Fe-S cluster assembly protein SufD [Burkholderiales bacterium]
MEFVNTGAKDRFLERLLLGQPPASPLGWLNQIRSSATERANALSVPTTRDEDWRFTDPSPLLKFSFQPARVATRLSQAEIQRFVIPEASSNRLVFIDGMYAADLSTHCGDEHGIAVTSMARGLSSHGEVLHQHLGRHANFQNDVFCALNTSFLHDGALVIINENVAYPTPIHLLFITTNPGTVIYPRSLVVAGAGSRCTLIEEYLGLEGDAYFNSGVTEIVIGKRSRVRHIKLQQEGDCAFHIAQCAVDLGRDSDYASATISLGARWSRHNQHVLQTAEGVHCELDGLALISGRQLADTHTFTEHAKPAGYSRQLHKCIVDDAAHAVFNGRVLVREGAQRTDSAQSSRNLLLSDKAHVDTKPQLEILADDVKCTHGATVGQLDAEEVFYLRSRGLDDKAARSLLTYAFAAEIINRIPVASLARRLRHTVMEKTHLSERA